ncbi:hypothetical protein MNEG_7451 [Monoraphidium neglectum]|uniref:Uncharacterized protein n=1 Tax=Monoraphidium neglectum TaxID=145388 RepID=A0A0D2MIN1_9CHLO|nr:hypothetical protein MNEG_7451 [Monoraphidium neglectum]KIZ00512.1 hypothetical protein MNEG_7451 [Monoraphidium neglectum]|eukprot:XP_013899531.1 hypothetical protein MNEG_7451 [Monoraphidium neglectum]
MLGPSPILRVGGRSQELLRAVPPARVFESLRDLARSVNMRFIIGLPLEENDTELARQIMDEARRHLGEAIVGFGLGNEPDMWDRRVGGFNSKGEWGSGFSK